MNSNREDAKDKFLKQAITPQTTKATAPGPHNKGPQQALTTKS